MSRAPWYRMQSDFLSDDGIIDLGDEHGPGGPLVMVALLGLAKQQDDAGRVRIGWRRLAREAFLDDPALARNAVTSAATIGLLTIIEQDDRLVSLQFGKWGEYQRSATSDAVRQQRRRDRLRERLVERDGPTCKHCGTEENLTIDHVLARSCGGTDGLENLQLLCGPCNSRKCNRTDDEALALRDADLAVRDGASRSVTSHTPTETETTTGTAKDQPSGGSPPRAARGDKQPSKTVDPHQLPDGFPDEQADTAALVLGRLHSIFTVRGGNSPTLRGVGLAIRSFPDRDHVRVADELEHWATAGNGAARQVRDWAQTYRTFLERSVPGRPLTLVRSEREQLNDERREAAMRVYGGVA